MTHYIAFQGHTKITSGALADVAVAVHQFLKTDPNSSPLIFDDAGKVADVDLRGSDAEIALRYTPPEEARGRGRPKLGVVPREITLMPRHWDWLNAQPGGASVALRKLVEEARKTNAAQDELRQKRDAAYRFMSAMAGDLVHFEEASRAFFAPDMPRFESLIAAWPQDIREHVLKLLGATA